MHGLFLTLLLVHWKMEGCSVGFEVNGKRYEVGEVDPSTTLLQFLRYSTPFKSVKLGCGEGGCGCCVVVLSRVDPVLNQAESFSANSCLTLLCSLNGYSITTSEGLGSSINGFHPIHQRFAGFHASQCGFCTPGMCMSLFSALANAATSGLSVSQAENSITGNLCRCTGYRPIEDACKSFAIDVDLEDLGLNSFWRRGEAAASKLPPFDPDVDVSPYIKVLAEEIKILNSNKLSWFTPLSVEELITLLDSAVEYDESFKLVVGNTGTGYYKETDKFDKYIDLRYIPELSTVVKGSSGIEFGAALPISKLIMYLEEEGESSSIFKNVAQHMERVASVFIRHTASIGGNLVMAQRNFFPSDIATLLLAVGSTLTLFRGGVQEKIGIDDFLNGPPLGLKDVVLSVFIPSGINASAPDSSFVFDSYRAAPRPLGNALPYLNAAFLAKVSSNENGVVVNYARLAFGAYGTKHATRATEVEEYLSRKLLTLEVVDEAVRLVRDAVVPEEGTSYPDYRKSLAVSYLFLFLSSLLDAKSDEGGSTSPPSEQFIEPSADYYPVGEPLPKTGALIQASGEAVYVDDIPSPPHCLYGALVCSTEALARVNGVSFNPSLDEACVVDVVSAKDIPEGGENIGGLSFFGPEPLFAGDVAQYAGDIIAFVVANGQKEANLAARMAQVEYDTEGLVPILSVEEAVERSSFFDVPPELIPENVGDFSQGMAEADHQILSAEIRLGSQYFFYMETQTALAIPDEDNCMVVYSSIQFPEYLHTLIAQCLGVPEHNVRVITRRVGGAFGGKCIRSMNVAAACAVAAHKLRRPVRIYVDRNTDMTIAGGRHPMKVTYTVGFKSNGKITALHLDILIDAGIYVDFSPVIPGFTANGAKKYDWGAVSFDIKLCKTNTTSKTTMRAPGDTQGNYIAEAIIERVAFELSMDVTSVREINLHSYESLKLFYGEVAAGEASEYTLPSIWGKIVKSQDYIERIGAMQQFNSTNIWHKRGISCIPIVYEVVVNKTSGKVSILKDGSVAVEVGGIEMGQGLWTKVRQATAHALGLIEAEGMEDMYAKVRVVQSDTLSLVQQGLTAKSTTSEASCAVVMQCCDVLVQRLSPLATRLRDETGSVGWDDLVLQAYNESINMQANSYFAPEVTSSEYLNYGAGVSEVEISCLTGEKWILRSDIIYDCGKSLNPAVDLGQIEGCFVQGVGWCMLEDYLTNEEGKVSTNSTWDYKIPSRDNIPKQLNVEVLSSGNHPNRILSSKASGEPPLLLAASVHCAIRGAVIEARKQLESWGATEGTESGFVLDVPATLPVVKQLCGLDYVEMYLHYSLAAS